MKANKISQCSKAQLRDYNLKIPSKNQHREKQNRTAHNGDSHRSWWKGTALIFWRNVCSLAFVWAAGDVTVLAQPYCRQLSLSHAANTTSLEILVHFDTVLFVREAPRIWISMTTRMQLLQWRADQLKCKTTSQLPELVQVESNAATDECSVCAGYWVDSVDMSKVYVN
jgi:hypothetical protein